MFRYIVVFLLINSSYRSLGGPVPSKAPVTIANLLTTLANNCENKFISNQIKNKLDYCTEITSPHQGKQLECMIFFDINSQLCTAIGSSKLVLTEDNYSLKINEEQDVTELCENTNEWVFSNITEFSHYKHSVEKVFEHPAMCGKVCGVEDLISDDANFFCKYFKWGTNVLKNQVSLPQDTAAQMPLESGKIETNQVISASNDIDIKIKNPTTSLNLQSESVSVKNEGSQSKVLKDEVSETKQVSELSSANSIQSEKPNIKASIKVEEPVIAAENQLEVNDPSDQEDKPIQVTNPELKSDDQKPQSLDTTLTKPEAVQIPKLEVDKEIQQLNHELEHKDTVIETPDQAKDKQLSDTEDYSDPEDEGKDGLGDMQGENDANDDMIGVLNKIDKQEDPIEGRKEIQSLKTSDITGESQLFPSFAQDDDDADDHFFSFFLTAVIMVVLIYVLYHNKNKVSKVFFGLMLEGRQSGRRRNSRGHAYRRLDTLEQAMSTNTAAPPSKIIY